MHCWRRGWRWTRRPTRPKPTTTVHPYALCVCSSTHRVGERVGGHLGAQLLEHLHESQLAVPANARTRPQCESAARRETNGEVVSGHGPRKRGSEPLKGMAAATPSELTPVSCTLCVCGEEEAR